MTFRFDLPSVPFSGRHAAIVFLATVLPLCIAVAPRPTIAQEAEGNEEVNEAASESSDLEARVGELVEQLGGSSLRGREEAQLALMKLGPEVLRYLPENGATLSSEARRRLEQVQVELERVRALSAAKPTIVHFKDVTTVAQAIEQIKLQTGNRLSGRFDGSATVELPAKAMTFWEAVDLLLDEADLDIDPYAGAPGEIGITPRQMNRPDRSVAASYSSLFRVEPIMITTRRNLTNPRLNETRLLIDVSWEPRIEPIRLALPLESIQVELSNGETLAVQESGGEPETTPQSDLANVEISLPLTVPPREAKAIKSISGKLSATLPGRRRKYEFNLDDKIPSDPNRAGNVAVKVVRLTPNGPLHEVRLAITFEDAGLALESHRTWIFENPVYALDPDGFRLDPLGLEVYRQTSEEVGMGYLFDFSGDPSGHRLIYETPAAIISTEVDFTLKEIPLP